MINSMSTGSPAIKSSSERLTNQRPRKRDCNVLKFHNFVPNKELSCFSRVRGSNENVLTGHCLKEENGSKQINVCNWQKKQQQQLVTTIENDKNDSSQQSIQLLKKEIPLISNDIVSTTATISSDDLTSQSILGSLLARNEINPIDSISGQSNEDSINGFTVINIGDNGVDGNDNNNTDLMTINSNYGFLIPPTRTSSSTTIKQANKINRRKPSTVRRFLRSSESPTNGDDEDEDYCDEFNRDVNNQLNNQDEPLDLSTAKKRPLFRKKGGIKIIKSDQFNQLIDCLPVLIPGTQITPQRLPQTMITSFLPYLLPESHQQQSNLTTTIKSVNSLNSSTNEMDSTILLKENKLLPHLSNNQQQQQHCIPMRLSADLISTKSSPSSSSSSASSITSMVNPLNNYLHHSSRGSTSTIPGVGHFKFHNNNHPTKSLPSSSTNHHHPHQYHQPINNRNHNQPVNERNTIKAKLENEFRTNGFLVKTKEVSDGEATFCKFRQLRKYTRYYLKSWHQHLPEEINKLWKGFLPPKTSKPTSSSSSSSATINSNINPQLDHQPNSPTLTKRITLNGQPMDITSSPYQPF